MTTRSSSSVGLAAALALSGAVTMFAQAPSGGAQAPSGGAQAPSGGAQAPSGGLSPAQMRLLPKALNAPDIPFKVVPNFMKLPPNIYMGEGIGIATNSKGHIFVNTCA